MTFDMDKARQYAETSPLISHMPYIAALDEIERLHAEHELFCAPGSTLEATVELTHVQAARIRELEGWLVEERAKAIVRDGYCGHRTPIKGSMISKCDINIVCGWDSCLARGEKHDEARDQLISEGKIGNSIPISADVIRKLASGESKPFLDTISNSDHIAEADEMVKANHRCLDLQYALDASEARRQVGARQVLVQVPGGRHSILDPARQCFRDIDMIGDNENATANQYAEGFQYAKLVSENQGHSASPKNRDPGNIQRGDV